MIYFVHEDIPLIISEWKAALEAELKRSIAPADTEMFQVNSGAYREALIRAQINAAGNQNLVTFSSGAALEELGILVGVRRLPAESASCTIRFTLVSGHTGVIIPAGTRIQSIDGKIVFAVPTDIVVPSGTLTTDVVCIANQEGTIGNGYIIGAIGVILDPQAFLVSASNTDATNGGANIENDDSLRERIKIAPASFSVAGPEDAYRFFAKSANAGIADVKIISPPDTGEVHIYVLMNNEQLPGSEVIAQVEAVCNDSKVRPISDEVIVEAATIIDYPITVDLTLLPGQNSLEVVSEVNEILSNYRESRKDKMGLDVVRSKITQLAKTDKVYDVSVTSPATNIVVDKNKYARCTNITVNIVGVHDE